MTPQALPPKRVPRLPPLPHEHGAWVALGAAALLGFALTGAATVTSIALALSAGTLFASRESLSALTKPSLAKRSGQGRLIAWAITLIALSLALALPAFLVRPPLILAGFAALAVLALHASSRRDNTDRTAAIEALAMAGIFTLAPLIDYAQRGTISAREVLAAATLAVTLAAGVTYAKMRIRQLGLREPRRRDLLLTGLPPVLWHTGALSLVLALALVLRASPLFALAPGLALTRCAWRAWRPKREKMAAVGRQETLLLGLEFVLVLAAAGPAPV